MRILLCTFMYLLLSAHMLIASAWNTLSLNGEWEYGVDKVYTQTTIVPGFPLSTKEMHDGRLWYRKVVELPQGDWNVAELELKGARFRPEVYVNGQKVSYKEGGMAKTTHLLKGVAPGQRVTLEVSLASLKDVPLEDASRIPEVDRWRSNVSSCLWDDVTLFLYRDARVNRVLVYPDMQKELQEMIRSRLTSVQRIQASNDRLSGADLVASVLQTDMDKIRMAIEEISRADFDVAVDELIPDSRNPLWFAAGFSLMMVLDVALG